ncbi:hypothetical protein M431DRAFT_310962 [Trichoderma harzianum CBS 226.95]|uniref:Uncharacterized protein n=1 Tax=Trichoderma harzianum CBS 226.95 TaxID=983964 RepID=A0A2T4ARG4_TRIHA|nr:hypothetical protein M431DRAFT_310962 [Trichoderma harzianum CBS 226.95]PTB59667.1 hypothetical protein M431DRAFT_310962 [Trichoderma harzianum CBS 226.95]
MFLPSLFENVLHSARSVVARMPLHLQNNHELSHEARSRILNRRAIQHLTPSSSSEGHKSHRFKIFKALHFHQGFISSDALPSYSRLQIS